MAKIKDYEEALEKQGELKTASKEAAQELKDFKKENKAKKGEQVSAKVAKKITLLEGKVEKAKERLAKINETVKSLKPKKDRKSKYDYPDGLTAAEKKKYRTKMRNSEKGDEDKPKKKKSKKADKADSEEKTSKKKKKKSKKEKSED